MERPMKTKQTPSADRPVARPRFKRILNLRLLVETLIVAAIIGPAGYAWYCYQVKHTADAMLDRAKETVEEKDDAAAAQYYFQYLKLKPGDADVRFCWPRRSTAPPRDGRERRERLNTTIRRWAWRRPRSNMACTNDWPNC